MHPSEEGFSWIPRHPRNTLDPPHLQTGPLGVDCFSHFPQAHCFVQHFYAGGVMKHEESRAVATAVLFELRDCTRVRRLLPAAAAAQLCGLGETLPVWVTHAQGQGEEEGRSEALAQVARAIQPFVDVVEIV